MRIIIITIHILSELLAECKRFICVSAGGEEIFPLWLPVFVADAPNRAAQ
jgi:hypothetical protein